MTWVKLDDGFFLNPRTQRAGKDGRALFLAGLCWTAHSLTDGHIPEAMLPVLAAQAEVRRTVAQRLVDAGLWVVEEGGWDCPSYRERNPSPERVVARREATRERVAKHRSNAGCNGVTGALVTDPVTQDVTGLYNAPVPVPVVDSVVDSQDSVDNHPEKSTPLSPDRRRDSAIQAVFDAWKRSAGKNGSTILDNKRRKAITTALKGYPLEDVCDAVTGWRNSPWHAGQNPDGKVYNELTLLLRDASKIEYFRQMARDGPPVPALGESANMRTIRQVSERLRQVEEA